MVEWSITTVLKTVVPRGTGGFESLSLRKSLLKEISEGFFISVYFLHIHSPSPLQEDFKCKIMLYYLVISKKTCNFAKK